MNMPKRIWVWEDDLPEGPLERFWSIQQVRGAHEYVAAAEAQSIIAAAVAEERERCARVAEGMGPQELRQRYEITYNRQRYDLSWVMRLEDKMVAINTEDIARAIRAATPLPAIEP